MTSTQIDSRATLPTMYDLPSEHVGDPGLPDEFHKFQPQLLDRTLFLAGCDRDNWFAGSDLNLYYDLRHPLWYKRPDWFLAVGVPRLYDGRDMRRSYVVWQEKHNPEVAIELLSPGTEADDLGRFHLGGMGGARDRTTEPDSASQEAPPSKLTVYEERLRVPHYLVYNRPTQDLRYFQLVGNRYQEQIVRNDNPKIWLSDLQIGLGIWEGVFEGFRDRWLRWCDEKGNWLPTDTERAEAERDRERAEKEALQAERDALRQRLQEMGVNPDAL